MRRNVAREWQSSNTKARPYLQKLVNEYTSLVDHCDIEWAPVLEEREVEKLVINGEEVVRRHVVRSGRLPRTITRSYTRPVIAFIAVLVQDCRIRRRLWKCGKIEPEYIDRKFNIT